MNTNKMPAQNRIKDLLDAQNITRYEFWKKTGLSQNTAYRLYDDPYYIPGGEVMMKIFNAYAWQPGEYIVCLPDLENPLEVSPDSSDEQKLGLNLKPLAAKPEGKMNAA